MSSGHFCSFNGPMDISLCPMDISVRSLDEWTYECPMDISVRPLNEWTFECPLDISVRLMDEWTFIYVQWTCNVYDAKEAVMT